MVVRDLLEEGLLFFNTGRFYEAHEVWEDLWRATDEPGLKVFYQGLIQAAVGLHHLAHHNSTGARSQLAKSIRNLQAGRGQTTGVDAETLVRELTEILNVMPAQPPPALRIARLK